MKKALPVLVLLFLATSAQARQTVVYNRPVSSGSSTVPAFITDESWDASGSLAGHFSVGGGSWTVRNGGVSTQNSTFTFTATQVAGNGGGLYLSSAPTTADACFEMKMEHFGGGKASNGPAIRVQTGSDGDAVWCRYVSSWEFFERFSGTTAQIGSGVAGTGPTTAGGDWVALCGVGTTLKIYKNGVLAATATAPTNVTAVGRFGDWSYYNDTNTGGLNYRSYGYRGYDGAAY